MSWASGSQNISASASLTNRSDQQMACAWRHLGFRKAACCSHGSSRSNHLFHNVPSQTRCLKGGPCARAVELRVSNITLRLSNGARTIPLWIGTFVELQSLRCMKCLAPSHIFRTFYHKIHHLIVTIASFQYESILPKTYSRCWFGHSGQLPKSCSEPGCQGFLRKAGEQCV